VKRLMFALAVCATTAVAVQPVAKAVSGHGRFDHSMWDAVLRKSVDDGGLVDYSGIKASRAFRDYLASLSAASADALIDDRDRLAFWINAYNALTIQAVLQTLPPDRSAWPDYRITEQKVGGKSLWKGIRFDVGGGRWTLDEIEHNILRKKDGLRDPRIHVALVCAARGCPPLWNRAFTGDKIDDQLAAAMKRFVSTPKQCAIDVDRRAIRISKVFEWYGSDFLDNKFTPHAASIPKFLAAYVVDEPVAKALLEGTWDVTYVEYDWKLNIQR
jgi:Protein of unknown function, DUF547